MNIIKKLKEKIGRGEFDTALEEFISILVDCEKKFPQSKDIKNLLDSTYILSYQNRTLISKKIIQYEDSSSLEISKNRILYNFITLLNSIHTYPEFEIALAKKSNATNTRKNERLFFEESVEILEIIQPFRENNIFDYDVFLSFSYSDIDYARNLWQSLRNAGIKVFFFIDDIDTNWIKVIDNALKSSQHFLLLLSKNSEKSKWVEIEYSTFFNEYYLRDKANRKLYTYIFAERPPEKIPLFLRSTQSYKSVNSLIKRVLNDISIEKEALNSLSEEILYRKLQLKAAEDDEPNNKGLINSNIFGKKNKSTFKEKISVDQRNTINSFGEKHKVFLPVGLPGSGKSSFIAYLLSYIRKNHLIQYNLKDNIEGVKYAHHLVRLTEFMKLPDVTRLDTVLEVDLDIQMEEHVSFTMLDLSGEELLTVIPGRKDILDQEIKGGLPFFVGQFFENKKIDLRLIFFIMPNNFHDQDEFLSTFLGYIKSTYNHPLIRPLVLITKFDDKKYIDKNDSLSFFEFLKNKLPQTYYAIKHYGIQPNALPVSIGVVDEVDNHKLNFLDYSYMQEILDWINESITSVPKETYNENEVVRKKSFLSILIRKIKNSYDKGS